MQLSAEQFDKILSALRSDTPLGSSKDKRRRPRVGLRASVTVIEHQSDGTQSRTPVMVRDVSREGIGLQRATPIKAGHRFLIQLPASNGEHQMILCTARHCESVGDRTHHIGATFVRLCKQKPAAVDESGPVSIKDLGLSAAVTSEYAQKKADAERIRRAILA